MTYKDKNGNTHNLDIVVKTGNTGDYGGGKTTFGLNENSGLISGDAINTIISPNFSPESNVLAHELGHGATIASDPKRYSDESKRSPNQNCQDPANRNTFISKNAVDWQEAHSEGVRESKRNKE